MEERMDRFWFGVAYTGDTNLLLSIYLGWQAMHENGGLQESGNNNEHLQNVVTLIVKEF